MLMKVVAAAAVVDAVAMKSNHFERLGIAQNFDIDIDELNKRYIALQMKYHPDIAGNDADSADVNYSYKTCRAFIRPGRYTM